MNGIILVLPIIFARYGLPGILNKDATGRVAFFPPTEGKEKVAHWVYQITALFLVVILIFIRINLDDILNYIGLGICVIAMILYIISIVQFSKPNQNGLNVDGLYKITRNPMYVTFFLYFLGCSILANSWLLLFILIIFQISTHYLILSEERWCIKKFKGEYKNYMNRVRRYI
ncbi:isoprenylcysteine carboxylmethyltransferase family protein [Vallitalea pronyensis]|uniref:Isoprenylcysteine carboxylmethyltransferase family protein n=1 Tax=Vallitalea pronyensis TaxID=1348613 RepID=A0A8J8MKK8_9FIRM|nr:isoprenylcysteine carboxylmethyltransferase family protein [Vallitalea pronyensis]QUI23013.1 isoprenylcysteine carboxylmethyltransferase family protein [Vallitalea pronyensis]